MTSSKKLAANQNNAKRSTGPKTIPGKTRSRWNARSHGLFARELLLAEEEKIELDALNSALQDQLRPTTTLQQVALQEVVSCLWRCELALRSEMFRVQSLSKPACRSESESGDTDDKALTRWYATDRQALREGRGFLFRLQQEIQENGGLHLEDWKEQIVTGFGDAFYEMLQKWAPMNIFSFRMAEMMVNHSETYRVPLPEEEDLRKSKVFPDPELSWQMALKLIELQLEHLHSLTRSYDQRRASAEANAGGLADFAPRYYTTATRDLHRAVDWFLTLRGKGL